MTLMITATEIKPWIKMLDEEGIYLFRDVIRIFQKDVPLRKLYALAMTLAHWYPSNKNRGEPICVPERNFDDGVCELFRNYKSGTCKGCPLFDLGKGCANCDKTLFDKWNVDADIEAADEIYKIFEDAYVKLFNETIPLLNSPTKIVQVGFRSRKGIKVCEFSLESEV